VAHRGIELRELAKTIKCACFDAPRHFATSWRSAAADPETQIARLSRCVRGVGKGTRTLLPILRSPGNPVTAL
jgi:hypothetical protein